jgi:C4-dicarboxylate transporter, DctM subunit
MILLMFVLLFLFLFMGIPIGFAISITSLISILILGLGNLMPTLVQVMYNQATSFPLLAIPFFILTGTLLNTGGMTERIFRFAKCLVGFMPGGLAQVNVLNSVIFSGMSGSAVADAAGIGKIEIKAMTDAGYDLRFSAAITAASATIGPVIPPSIPFVVYGSLTGVSVDKLFLGGIGPGLGMGIVLMIAVHIISKRRNYPKEKFPGIKETFIAGVQALPALFAPVLIIGGIIGGFFTPTEASVIAAAYSIVMGAILGDIGLHNIGGIFKEAFFETVKIMFIVVSAALFGWILVFLRGPDLLVSSLMSFSTNPNMIILLIVILLLILGCFMESIAIILTVVPILAPFGQSLGFDPIHLGVVIVLALMIGLITPPVGMTLFAVCTVTGLTPEQIYSEAFPYIIALVVLLLIVMYYPPLTLFIPNLIG